MTNARIVVRALALLLGVISLLETSVRVGAQDAAPSAKPAATPIGNQIFYHGGSVMASPTGTNLYYIWYGNWSGSTTPEILTDLAKNLGGSTFFNVLTTYYDASNAHVANRLNYLGSTNDAYSQGTSLDRQKIKDIVTNAIQHGLPKDTNAFYYVLASEDVDHGNLCTILGANIKFGFIGSANRCLDLCTPRLYSPGKRPVSPNGNEEADGMANFLTNHLMNAITNPDGFGWDDSQSPPPSFGRAPIGLDISHICKQWWDPAFTNAYVSSNGSYATVRLGKRDFLIASKWVNAKGGGCQLSYP